MGQIDDLVLPSCLRPQSVAIAQYLVDQNVLNIEKRTIFEIIDMLHYFELSCISKMTVALSGRDPISLWVGLPLSPVGKKLGHVW